MATVILTPPQVGDPITHTALNAVLTEWNTASIDVDEDQVRVEGVDRRNIQWSANPVVELMGSDAGDVNVTNTASGSPSNIITLTGMSLDRNDGDKAWIVAFTAMVDGRAPVRETTSSTTPHDTHSPRYNFELMYRETNSAPWTASGQIRRIQLGWHTMKGELEPNGSVALWVNLRPLVGGSWGSATAEVAIAAWEDSYSSHTSSDPLGETFDVLNYELSVLKIKR